MSATTDTLVLNFDTMPLGVVPWPRAVGWMLENKARLEAAYEDRWLRSFSVTIPWPAVVRLTYTAVCKARLGYSHANVFARDRYRCQYCGGLLRPKGELRATIDHVVPRAASIKGRVRLPWNGKVVLLTGWQNTVACCYGCNVDVKRDLMPNAQGAIPSVGLQLARFPSHPSYLESIWIRFQKASIPPEWEQYAPESWREG